MPANCYYIRLYNQAYQLIRRVAGADTIIASGWRNPATVANVWYNYRFTWYTWLDLALNPVLRLILDEFISGAWFNWITFDDQPPYFSAPGDNWIGLGVPGGNTDSQCWVDDTYVYRRA